MNEPRAEAAPDTPALDALAELGVEHSIVVTGRVASVEEAAAARGIPVEALIKTIVVRRGDDDYVFVLVPGDRVIDWAKLREHLGVRRLSLPEAAEALQATGYPRGAITPYGSARPWQVVMDERLRAQPVVSLGGGAHGVSVRIRPEDIVTTLDAVIADVTKPA